MKCLFVIFLPVFELGFSFELLHFLRVLYIFWILIVCQINDLQVFLPVCGYLFFLLTGSFTKQKGLILVMSSLSVFPLALVLRLRTPRLVLDPRDDLLCDFPQSFPVLHLRP